MIRILAFNRLVLGSTLDRCGASTLLRVHKDILNYVPYRHDVSYDVGGHELEPFDIP